MAGCTTGIEKIEVKAPNGKPSLLFQQLRVHFNGNLDQAYNAYLKLETMSVDSKLSKDSNGEIGVSDAIKTLSLADSTYFSKTATAPSTTKTDPDSLISKVLEASKMIVDPEKDVDGNEANTYGISPVAKGIATSFVGRVSTLIGQFTLRKTDLKDSSGKEYPSQTEAIIHRDANTKFKNKLAGETVEEKGIAYTKAEYIEFKRKLYKQGMVKGSIIHALLQLTINFNKAGTQAYTKIQQNLDELEGQSDREKGSYNWVTKKENFTAIMKNAGIVIGENVPEDLKDQVHSEVPVFNALMGFAGKIDTLVSKPSGRLKIIDYKTGVNFDKSSFGNLLMKFGNQENSIYDNSMGKAKLQAMLYSVIIKANNPDALFDAPVIIHIPDESSAKDPRTIHQVEVRDFLKMIEQYYRTEQPAVYKALLEASPRIFHPSDYGSTVNTSFTQDLINDQTGMLESEHLKKYELQLEQYWHQSQQEGFVRNKAVEKSLADKILQARDSLGLPLRITKDHEISKFTEWLGNIGDTHNPYLQSYLKSVNQARLELIAEQESIKLKFRGKLQLVVDERIGKRSATDKALKPLDKQRLFNKYMLFNETEIEGERVVKRGMITPADPEWQTLTAKEQDLLKFMQESIKEVYNHVMVSGPNAVVSTARSGKNITKQDLYNEKRSAFKMTDSFIPKIPITSSEIRWNALKNGLPGTVEFVKRALINNLTQFNEQHVTGENQQNYGIPAMYLGTGSTPFNPEIHSSNLELAYETFMDHMLQKKHYDSVYALGDVVKTILNDATDENNNPIARNAANLLNKDIELNLLGRIRKDENLWRKGFRLYLDKEGREINFSPAKLIKFFTTNTAKAALMLNVPSSAKNMVQATWAVWKEGLVGGLAAQKWTGIDVDTLDTTIEGHNKAVKDWASYQAACAMGRGTVHPVHVFINTFKFFPSQSELRAHRDSSITAGGTLYNADHLTALYAIPEEATTAILAINMARTMKVPTGPYKGQSMWDVYSASVKPDPITGEGVYELPADFTRGKLRMGDGSLQELKGFNALDIGKMRAIIKNVKGGYRIEERSMIEASIIGESFMLFRRYLPASILSGFRSKKYEEARGFYAKTEEEDVYQWQGRMIEGKWRTLAGMAGNLAGVGKLRGYQWADLSDMQKKSALDAGITLATWALTGLLVSAAFADDDEEDSLRKLAVDTNMRLIDQWNFIDWANAATSQPAAIKRTLELMNGLVQVSIATGLMAVGGADEDIYTRRGDLRGLTPVLKNIPGAASIYNNTKFIEDSDYLSE